MSDSQHDFLIKLLAIALFIWGLVWTADGLKGDGAFWKAFVVIRGLVVLATAIGFARYRGWAFLLVSVGLLYAFLAALIQFILTFDTGGDKMGAFWKVALVIALIGYLGNWNMERRFRPHLDDHHH